MTTRAYLDAAGAARPDPAALTGLTRALGASWGNPHRPHSEGRQARAALDAARELFAHTLAVRPDDVIFTSSHVQALHLGVLALAAARSRVGSKVVAARAERTSALHAAAFAGRLTPVEVDGLGRIDLDGMTTALREEGVALGLLHVGNGEVGTLQPVDAVHEVARGAGVPLLVDAASAAGSVPLPQGWDVLALDGGEWGSPVRLGVLVARSRVRMRPRWPEDADAWFPGGVDPAAAFATAVAFEQSLARLERSDAERRALTGRVRAAASSLPGVRAVGDPDARLPHVVTLAVDGVDGEALSTELDRRGVAVGTGSACSSSTIEPSHVLTAMGARFDGSIRLTLDAQVTTSEIDLFLEVLAPALARVRSGEPRDATA